MNDLNRQDRNPLVSIIIPVFNSERFLAETIQSALDQSWLNKEIIIINDGSADNSLKIAERSKSDQVKIINQENLGASAARNRGLKEAKGDYIQFLDADDLLSPDKIESQLKLIIDNSGKIAFCSTVYFFENSNNNSSVARNHESIFYKSSNDPAGFLIDLYGRKGNGGLIAIHSWLVHRDIINKAGLWDESLSVDDDGEYFCRVVLNSKKIIFTENVWAYYRKHNNGFSLSSQRSHPAKISSFNSLILKERHLSRALPKKDYCSTFATSYYKLAMACYPKYKTLSKECIIRAKALDKFYYKKKIITGGILSNFISNNLSWKLTGYIHYYKQKLRAFMDIQNTK